MLPASIQVCPVELPGRGRRGHEPAIDNVQDLARLLARSLPLSDKPYAIFGTCLGAILGYEIIREVEQTGRVPPPVVFMPAAVSPPHLYAVAVMKIYLSRKLSEWRYVTGGCRGYVWGGGQGGCRSPWHARAAVAVAPWPLQQQKDPHMCLERLL